jgi:eukaryotic-like serine/threonine-protein kinase
MKCPQCSTQLEDNARFCGACGARMDASGAVLGAKLGGPSGQSPQPARPASSPNNGSSGASGSRQGNHPVVRHNPNAGQGKAAAAAVRPMPSPVPAQGPPPMARHPHLPPAGPPRDPYIGKTLNNRYIVESKMGQGGFGAVYKGKQVSAGREVALKLLHPEMNRDPNLVARFRREGAVSCNLRDAHTVTTYDFDQTPEGILYIAMELLKGRSLHDIFHESAPLPWTRVAHIIEQMCSSLGEAHAQGIVHRDIKPENIYVEDRPGHPDFVKVLDFGIAKIVGGETGIGGAGNPQLTATGQTLGTLEYMSPEQLMGKQLDGRSDVYAMGVLAFELMTGRLPFPDATGPAELIAAQLKKTPPPPSSVVATIPAAVDATILKMLEKSRDKRFVDVNELRETLASLLASAKDPSGLVPLPPQVASGSTPSAHSRPPAAAAPSQAPQPAAAKSAPPQAKPVGKDTQAAINATTNSKWWIYVLVASIFIGGAIALVLLLAKN